MGIVFLTTGAVAALCAASALTSSDWLTAAANLVIGAEIERSGPPAGVINITLGLMLLLVSWDRRRRRKHEKPATAGAKSRALRDALATRMRRHDIPVPA